MKPDAPWIVTSLLAVLFTTFHLVHDIAIGIEQGGLSNLPVVLGLVVWLCGMLLLAGRRSGYLIVLLMSLFASSFPVVHMLGKSGITAGLEASGEAFFFAWTLLALGVTGLLSAILSARGLWDLRKARRP